MLMRRLAVVILTTATLLSIAIGMIRAAGMAGPPAMQGLLVRPDGAVCPSPCILGIRPRQTTYSQAISYIQTHPLTQNFVMQRVIDGAVFEGEGILLALTKGTGDELLFMNLIFQGTDGPFNAGALVGALGMPSSVRISEISNVAELFYPDKNLYAMTRQRAVRAGRLSPADHLDGVTYFVAFPPLRMVGGTRWRGFTSTARYQAAQRAAR